MAGLSAAAQSLYRFLVPRARPRRVIDARRVRLFAAAASGMAGGMALLAAYYATLGLLPAIFAFPTTEYPVAAWAHRLDLAQFAGTFLLPPTPTPLTWWVGLIILLGMFTALGVVYAVLLAWTLKGSNLFHGTGYGAALFAGLALTLSVANGLHPAIMRNVLPDTGLFLLGWSWLATLHLLGVHLLYGAVLGGAYARLAR